jgi:hypothetical protein
MNSPTTRVDLETTSPAKVILKGDTLVPIKNRTKMQVERNIQPLTLKVFNDSISKTINIDSRNSFAYWFNIYANSGLGMLVDKDRSKRYTYPGLVYVDMSNNSEKYYRYYPLPKKGRLFWHISLPYINIFNFKPDNEPDQKINTGFWGIKTGINFFWRDYQFLDWSVSAVNDFFIPVPAAIDISGEYEMMGSIYTSLSQNYQLKRWTAGLGICFAKNIWSFNYSDRFDPPPPSRVPVRKSHYSVGMVFPIYYQMGEHFSTGIIYRPTFFQTFPDTGFKYEHLISIDFAWRFQVNK